MILVYPMLTSQNISPNVLPGIIKAVEKYILIYNTDDLLRSAGATSAGQIIATGGEKLGTMAGTAVGGEIGGKLGGRIGGEIGGAITSSKDNTSVDGDPLSEAKPAPGKKAKAGGKSINITFKTSGGGGGTKPQLDLPRGDAISLEPTWLQVTTKKKGLQILGVKVVPFRIKSSESVTSLIADDKKLKGLDMLSARYGRGLTRMLHRVMQHIPFLGGKPISGDPKKDILLGKTQYKSNMFMCLSQMDLENEDVFNLPGGIQKLHKLGWASFIIVDDVNRRTTFCMKEFGGVCSVIPFNFMYTSVGKDYNQAYEDLEDIKKASGPFFNRKNTNRKKMFTESSMTNVNKYLELIQKKQQRK